MIVVASEDLLLECNDFDKNMKGLRNQYKKSVLMFWSK
jgi:hypothetical protein